MAVASDNNRLIIVKTYTVYTGIDEDVNRLFAIFMGKNDNVIIVDLHVQN